MTVTVLVNSDPPRQVVFTGVRSSTITPECGILVIFNVDGEGVKHAYAPGQWLEIWTSEDVQA